MYNKEFMNNYTIKDLPEVERPREKLIRYGSGSLSNAELIAIIIRMGNKNETSIELGKKVLALDERGLSYLRDCTLEELTQIKGIGNSKAAQILAAIEIGKRISYEDGISKMNINSPRSIANVFMDDMRYLQKEHFKVVLLDTKNQIISTEEISVGTLNASIVHPRDVFKIAIKKNSNSMILLHNHPSGDPYPSQEDISVTKRLIEVGNIVGIKIIDHIIIGDNKYISFKEEKLM